MNTTITLRLIALNLVLTSTLLLIVAAPPPPPPPSSCVNEIILFSPCLPYVSSPPNNLSDTASESCCDAFSSALNSTNGVCLCYLVRQPSILGFPVNDTKVLSLSSLCPIKEDNSSMRNGSLESLCSGSPALPPLRSTTISGLTNPSASGPISNDVGSPPEPEKNSSTTSSSPPEFAKPSPTLQNSSLEPARVSSATKQLCSSYSWFPVPPSIAILLVPISIHLYS
uniref:Bifunctional inhibitor/plant lipid transfer protein/seed storage helical domain-containing protein n=1 Tax=Fagus sylvatica TaxID=28930 RepID=A0A2N9F5I3_FAGSY